MVYTKIQPQIFLGSTEDFQAFLPYMGIAAILFNGAEPFKKNCQYLSTEGPCEIWRKLLMQFQRRRQSKIHNFIHVYSLGARTDNPQGTKF